MKKFLVILLLAISVYSCEVDYYNCYTFEVRREITYIPYRQPYYDFYTYEVCNMSYYMAVNEAESNEYSYTYYSSGYYVTERQTCTFW